MLGPNIIAFWSHLFHSSCLFYYSCLLNSISFFFYFYYTPSSLAYKLGINQYKYKQSSSGLDTHSSVLIFTTCDKTGTLANQLTGSNPPPVAMTDTNIL